MKPKSKTRIEALHAWLKSNHISGHYHTIEYICENLVDPEGNPLYALNKNPYCHDKCRTLSYDIREINWDVTGEYSIILRDKKGSVKLCETKEEFLSWKAEQIAILEPRWMFLNNLVWKDKQEGTTDLFHPEKEPREVHYRQPGILEAIYND